MTNKRRMQKRVSEKQDAEIPTVCKSFNLDKVMLHNAQIDLKEKAKMAEQIMIVATALTMLAAGLYIASMLIDSADFTLK